MKKTVLSQANVRKIWKKWISILTEFDHSKKAFQWKLKITVTTLNGSYDLLKPLLEQLPSREDKFMDAKI